MPRRVTVAIAIAVVWGIVWMGFSLTHQRSEDSTLLILVLAFEIPAFWALVTAKPAHAFGWVRAAGLAIPVALAIAFCAFLIGGRVGGWIDSRWFFDAGFGLVSGIAVCPVTFVLACRVLRSRNHPDGARRAMAAIAIALAMAAALLILADDELRVALVFPLAWSLPLWPLVLRGSSGPAALAPAPVRPVPRFAVLIAAAWVFLSLVSFLIFFTDPLTDDFAGWILAMLALELPAFWALAPADPDAAVGLAPWRAVALAIPALVVAALCVLIVGLVVADAVWPAALDATWHLVLCTVGPALLALLALALRRVIRALRERPHPDAARSLLAAIAVGSAVALVAAFVLAYDVIASHRAYCIPLIAAVGWPVPLWPLLFQARRIPEARMHRR